MKTPRPSGFLTTPVSLTQEQRNDLLEKLLKPDMSGFREHNPAIDHPGLMPNNGYDKPWVYPPQVDGEWLSSADFARGGVVNE